MATLRIAVPADAGAIAAAEAAIAKTPGLLVGWPGEIPIEAYRARIAGLATTGRYLVAEESGVLAGHASLTPMPMRGNAHVFKLDLAVHPGHGGRGIGSALLHALLRWAEHDPRVGKVELNVRAGNAPARHLYQQFGFEEEAVFRKRVRRSDDRYEDDIGMAWFPGR